MRLREFHLGRRRFKAMLLAVMVGYADQALARERGAGTAQLGSRRAAMDVFDSDNNGYVTTEDIKRVARLLGDELDEADTRQMLRSVARPGTTSSRCPKKIEAHAASVISRAQFEER